MRCGIPARKTSIAERGELGKTSARSNFPARSFLPTAKTLSRGAKEIVSFDSRMIQPKFAQFFRCEQRDMRVGKFFAQPQQRGVVITASPSQFMPRMRIRGERGIGNALKVHCSLDVLNLVQILIF